MHQLKLFFSPLVCFLYFLSFHCTLSKVYTIYRLGEEISLLHKSKITTEVYNKCGALYFN